MMGRLNLFSNNESARDGHLLGRARDQMDTQFRGVRPSTKALVGMLLTHGARALRSSQPKANLRVIARDPHGHIPVRIRMGQ